jgi:hypothetical protein
MKGKPNLNEFLGSASADKPEAIASTQHSPRITKTIRIAVDMDAALKEAAHARWKATGRRVSESDLIEEALRNYLNK